MKTNDSFCSQHVNQSICKQFVLWYDTCVSTEIFAGYEWSLYETYIWNLQETVSHRHMKDVDSI